jgi:hypothetical protein
MTKLRRKPSPDLSAYQWTGDENIVCSNNKLYAPNPSGILVAELDDWIVRRVPGDVYVVRADDREALFDIIEEITDA